MPTGHFDDIAIRIQTELSQARYSIKVAMAWLTERSLITELNRAANRGVKVEVVVSRNEGNQWARLNNLVNNEVEVLLQGPPETGQAGFLHHKFCVVDYSTVITGSYNWSANAGRNLENILIAHDDQATAAAYLAEFQKLLASATPLLAELASVPTQPVAWRTIFGWNRNLKSSQLDVLAAANTPQAQAAQVRLWAARVLGAPGDQTTLHWQAPPGLTLAFYGLSEQEPATDGLAEANSIPPGLPPAGHQTVTFGAQPRTITLVATAEDGSEVARRVVQLVPAWRPVIEKLELDRLTIVGRLLPATISWRVLHAETVRLEPGPAHDLPAEGELTVSPGTSTTYVLLAKGLGGEVRRSVSLGVFPVPVMSRLEVPALSGLLTRVQLSYAATPVPSGLDLSEKKLRLRHPRLRTLQSELLPNPPPTLADLASGRGHASPAGLRWPAGDDKDLTTAAPRPRWTGWRLSILDKLEARYQHHPRLSYLLSTIRKLYA